MHPETKTLFVAADLPATIHFDNVQKFVAKSLNPLLQNKGAKFIVSTPHITLLFIGKVPTNKIAQVQAALQTAINTFIKAQGKGSLTGFSIAPGAHLLGANAIVTDMTSNSALQSLFNHLYNQVSAVMKPKQLLPFIPHITVGRISPKNIVISLPKQQLKEILQNVNPPVGARGHKVAPAETFGINSITLYQASGTQYIPLATYAI